MPPPEPDMKQKLIELSRHYVTALRTQLQPGARTFTPCWTALELGRQAVVLGVETLDLARIHEHALTTLKITDYKTKQGRRAGIFFTEANTLIEETHHAVRQGRLQVGRLTNALGRCTEELATSKQRVQRGAARRKVMADDFEKSGKDHDRSLEESLGLQKRLRLLTHRILAAQEDNRQKISKELQDEIAQTLLGINVRLLSLKQEARGNAHGIKSGIAHTRKLVTSSAKAVRQMARELRVNPPSVLERLA